MAKSTFDPDEVFVPAPTRGAPAASIWNRPSPDPEYDRFQEERLAVWAKISPQENWKTQINAWIAEADLAECVEAAAFFAGSPLEIAQREGARVRVIGPGYYACVGS